MNNRLEDKYSMYFAVEATCAKHAAAWAALPAFVTHHTAFTDALATLSAEIDRQRSGITGATRDKSAARQTLAERAFPIGTATQAWALVEGDHQLAARVYHPITDYFRGRDTEAAELARTVHAEATTHLADLADYGVDQTRLDDLAAAISAYHTALTAPRGAIIDRKSATAALAEGFQIIDDLLNNRLDKLVPILAPTQPAFAADYQNARIIVDTGSRPSSSPDADDGGAEAEADTDPETEP